MAHPLSPEFLLTAACAMWPPSEKRNEAIRTAATGPLDWAHFLRVVKRHQVLGLVHNGLMCARPRVPSEVAQAISAEAVTVLRESLAMAAEAVRLQRVFDDVGLEVLFLKGPLLAVLAYGNLALRNAKDIDLLVDPDVVSQAAALIIGAGYRRLDPPPNVGDTGLRRLMPFRKDLGFVHKSTGQHIELHWKLFLNSYAMNDNSVTRESRIIPLTRTTQLRTLGDEDLFTFLCVHGALHWWNQLKWLADIGALLASAPKGDVTRLKRAGETRGAGQAVRLALLLCHRILQVPLPDCILTSLGNNLTIRWLEDVSLNTMNLGEGARDSHEVRFGTTRGSLSGLLLARGWRYRLTEIRKLLFNETDILAIPLPQSLNLLYPIMRFPLWLWRHAKNKARKGRQPF